MLTRLRSAIYAAPDLPKLKAFYSALLGAPPYFDQPYYVGYDVDGFELGLDPDAEVASQPIAYWRVDDLEQTIMRCEALGATPRGEIREVGGGVRMAVLRDPVGNLLGLIAERGEDA
jgi:predicted enzyme related to lactoylglutathione lyase